MNNLTIFGTIFRAIEIKPGKKVKTIRMRASHSRKNGVINTGITCKRYRTIS